MTQTTTAQQRTNPRPGAGGTVRPLNFSGAHVGATVVTDAAEHRVAGRAIVVNCGTDDLYVAESPRRPVPPLTSTIVADTTILHAGLAVVLRSQDEKAETIAGITRELRQPADADVERSTLLGRLGAPLFDLLENIREHVAKEDR